MKNRVWVLLTMCLYALTSALRVDGSTQSTPPDSVRLKIVFPADGDTLNFERIRYAGSALPEADVNVQGQSTYVYESGAFVGMVDLEIGENEIPFVVSDSLGSLTDTVRVLRQPSKSPLPEIPTAVRYEEISPSTDVSILPGEELQVSFVASPGGRARFSIDKLAKDSPMLEVSASRDDLSQGLYQGSIIVPNSDKYKPKSVEFKFRGRDGRKLKFKSVGRIHLLSPTVPAVAVTRDSTNLILTDPNGDVWMEFQPGIKMQVIGQDSNYTKVRLSDDITGYIQTRSLNNLQAGEKLPFASIGSIGTVRRGDWIQLRMNLSDRVPFRILQMLEPAALEISFYRARQAPHWISYPADDETIKVISWRQETGEIFVLRVELNQQQQWGFEGRYVADQFRLNIRRTPSLIADPGLPLKGVTVTVDPGHGGEFEGATSPTGLFEKDLNLKYARRVAELLDADGAKVVLTRTTDTTMTLQQRVTVAKESESHVLISLHNNSIGPTTNPVRPRGTSTYYTVPQSQAISKSVYQGLLTLGLHPFGMVSSTYFVTRQTGFLALIVEGAFLSHPEDEMLLLDETFLEELAQAVVKGVRDFVLNAAEEDAQFMLFNGGKRVQPTQPKRRNF